MHTSGQRQKREHFCALKNTSMGKKSLVHFWAFCVFCTFCDFCVFVCVKFSLKKNKRAWNCLDGLIYITTNVATQFVKHIYFCYCILLFLLQHLWFRMKKSYRPSHVIHWSSDHVICKNHFISNSAENGYWKFGKLTENLWNISN